MRDGERRLKIVIVDERALLQLFSPLGQCVSLRLNNPKLPADVRVVSVNHDYNRRALAVTVESREFPKVPDGAMIPLFDEQCYTIEYEARYVVGDRLTPFKPMAVAIQEQAAMHAASNALGPMYVTQEVWEKSKTCDTIVDQPPDMGKAIAGLLERATNGDKITWGEVTKAIGYRPEFRGPVPVTRDGKVIGTASPGKDGNAEIFINKNALPPEKTEAQKIADGDYRDRRYDMVRPALVRPDVVLPAPVFPPIPANVINAGESNYGSSKEAEAEFFRKSIMAE